MPAQLAAELLPAALPAPARGAFTTRDGGLSTGPYAGLNLSLAVGDEQQRVATNRELLVHAVGADDLVLAQQVHGAGVAVVSGGRSPAPPAGLAGVDALVTDQPGLGLLVLAADCLPVLLADPVAGVVAAAHAGRQGLVAGVLQCTVAAMAGLGARPEAVTAVLGPAAGGCCYEVPQEMADAVEAAVPGSATRTRAGTQSVDLRAGAEALLRAAGVGTVQSVAACTVDDPRFYSYRRSRVTGRHGGVVLLVP